MSFDASNFNNWRNIKQGQIISLSDENTLKYGIEEGFGFRDAFDFKVEKVNRLDFDLFTVLMIDINSEELDQNLTILVRKLIGEDKFDISVNFIADESNFPNTRDKLGINSDTQYIFNPPEDQDKLFEQGNFSDLEFTDEIIEDIENESILYEKEFSTIFGNTSDDTFAQMVSYQTDSDVSYDRITIIELGGADIDGNVFSEGGLVNVYQGCCVNTQDVKVF